MKKNKMQSLVDNDANFIDDYIKLQQYAESLNFLPPQGEGARNAVTEEINELCRKLHKRLNKLNKIFVDIIWENEE